MVMPFQNTAGPIEMGQFFLKASQCDRQAFAEMAGLELKLKVVRVHGKLLQGW